MTIVQLETFLKITETGSFTAASNTLGYAQVNWKIKFQSIHPKTGT